MADTDIIVSEMTPASQINTGDLMIMTQPDAQAETGYSTKSATVLQVTNKQLKGIDFPTDLPSFNNPKVLGGLEELKADIKALLPVSSASGNLCTFETNLADTLVSLKAAIVASGGNGTLSTPIPIVGHSELNLGVNGDTFTVSFGQTVYGGVYDANAGKVSITQGYILVDENTPSMSYNGATSETVRAFIDVTGKAFGSSNILSDRFQLLEGDVVGRFIGRNNSIGVEFYLPPTVPHDTAGVKAWFGANNTQLVFELATPIEIDVSELSVNTIVGTNNITSDCGGDVTASYKVSIQKYVDDQ